MVQRGGQWAAAGPGSAGQWRRRTVPRSSRAGAALRRPPAAGPPACRRPARLPLDRRRPTRRRRRRPVIGPRRLRVRLRRARVAAAPACPAVLGPSPARLPAGAGTQARGLAAPHDAEAEAHRRKVIHPTT